jgi:preprotein translocase subunit SecG
VITFLTVLHIANCVFLAFVVLLQHGKGADVGATFGGSSNTVFGARGAATILSKVTSVSAIVFMVTSILLATISAQGSKKSLMEQSQKVEASPTPEASGVPAATTEKTASPVAPEQKTGAPAAPAEKTTAPAK